MSNIVTGGRQSMTGGAQQVNSSAALRASHARTGVHPQSVS